MWIVLAIFLVFMPMMLYLLAQLERMGACMP